MSLGKRILIVGNGSTSRIDKSYYKDQHTAQFLKDLSERFAEVYWLEQVVVSSSINNNLHAAKIDDSVKLVNKLFFGKIRLVRAFGLITILAKYIISIARFNFIYLYFSGTLSFLCALVAVTVKRPYGLYIRCDFYAANALEKLIVKKAKFIMVVGSEFKQRLAPYSNSIFQVSPMIGFSMNEIKKRENYDFETPKLLFVGRLEKAKGVYVILEALNKLIKKEIDFEFHFAGGGDALDALKEQCTQNHLTSKVIFHGLISDKAMLLQLYERSDIFVFTSFHEGFPRVLYEAMAKSIPIITTEVGSIPALMQNQKNCITIKKGDSEDLARKIEILINNRELRERIGKNGAETLHDFLSSLNGKSHSDQIEDKVKEISL